MLGMGAAASEALGAAPDAARAAAVLPSLPDFSRGPGAASGALGSQWRAIAQAFQRAGQTAVQGEGGGQSLLNAHARRSAK
jgi:hypothetical protein